MTGKTAFFHDERCLWHSTAGLFSLFLPVGGWVQPPAGAGLAESPETKRRIVSLLQVSNLASEIEMLSAPSASEADLLRVHPQSYLEKFKSLSDDQGGELGLVAPFGPGSYDIAKVSAGLSIAGVDSVLSGKHQNAYVMSRPPGHHCLPDQPMGFCLLANIAIAIEAAFAKHGIKRAAVIDWDVHHGNGTQACFYDTLSVKLLFSAGRRFVICSRKHSLAEQLMRMKSRLQWLLGAELQNQTRRHHVSFMVCVEILSKFVNADFASQTITVSSATCTCV